jgi:ornithine cyclodeaminase
MMFSAAAIFSATTPGDLVETLAQAFLEDTSVPDRLHYPLEADDALLVMPAWRLGGVIGVKVVTVMPGNAAAGHPTVDGAYLLLDGRTGGFLATFDAAALTQVRTAAVSALAASAMARTSSRRLLMVGTGALAPHLIRAHMALRPIDQVTIWGRSRAKAEALADTLKGLPCALGVADDLAASVSNADIISCATSSDAPLVHARDVGAGTHVDLVGSFRPSMLEADTDLVARAGVVVDSLTALHEAGELVAAQADGVLHQGQIRLLKDVLRAHDGRRSSDEITVFKSVGVGLADLAVAERIHFLLKSQPTGPGCRS